MSSEVIFYKYQATGNDFILVDNRNHIFPKAAENIQFICNRKFGVGSDGLILIEKSAEADFEMVFYNPDASMSFCGNGSRAAVKFARDLGMVLKDKLSFKAIDGKHLALINGEQIEIRMNNIEHYVKEANYYFINTGSPHYMEYHQQIDAIDIIKRGREIRYDDKFMPAGTNVNFVEIIDQNTIYVRTYERGVENETLSCGTGVTACALSFALQSGIKNSCTVKTKGGVLRVKFNKINSGFSNIWLCGPADFVFKGEIKI
jgi:diaminopimelate epimerase